MNRVIRIQDSSGRGPYKPGFSSVWSEYRCLIAAPKQLPFMDEFPKVMGKINDIYEKKGGSFGCAFRSMEQLNNWFKPSELEKLRKHGYQIVEIEADEVLAESENQTVFWCKRPFKKAAMPLVTNPNGVDNVDHKHIE